MRIAILSGGQGGLKLFEGLRELLNPNDITIIANTADNIWLLGLYIAPDVDSATYLLSGLLDISKYWGILNDTFNAYNMIKKLGALDWFVLGDKDLAIHIVRTYMLKQGYRLTEITKYICSMLKAKGVVLPMSDTHVETHIHTDLGVLHVQEYLVKYAAKHDPEKIKVFNIEYKDIDKAYATKEVINTLNNVDAIIIGPSNPFLSINPILNIKGVKECIRKRREMGIPVIAISPIKGSKAFTGVTHILMKYLGFEQSPYSIAEIYSDIISNIIIDNSDEYLAHRIKGVLGVDVDLANIAMDSIDSKIALARRLLGIVTNYQNKNR